MIIYTNLLPKGIMGITLYPFIFIKTKYKNDNVLCNHERIHLRQQAELLIIFFYLWYLIEYLIKGYKDISFEQESNNNERNFDYLSTRKIWSFIKYV